jgi:hypothetical protein
VFPLRIRAGMFFEIPVDALNFAFQKNRIGCAAPCPLADSRIQQSLPSFRKYRTVPNAAWDRLE